MNVHLKVRQAIAAGPSNTLSHDLSPAAHIQKPEFPETVTHIPNPHTLNPMNSHFESHEWSLGCMQVLVIERNF